MRLDVARLAALRRRLKKAGSGAAGSSMGKGKGIGLAAKGATVKRPLPKRRLR